MKIKSKKLIKVEPTDVYDVVNSPTHNFLISTNSSTIVSHNCCMMDEVDYAKDSSIDAQSKIMKIYNTLKRRMESRFMKLGIIPGMLLLVSSKNSEDNFLEQYINENRTKPYLKIIDDPLWVVKANEGNYSGKKFNLAVGDKYRPSKILSDEEDPSIYESVGQKVIEVPIEHKEAFEQSMNQALTDIAGIAISSHSKFLSYNKIKIMYKDYLCNPFKSEVIQLGFDDDSQIIDFLDESKLSKLNRGKAHYIHWDASVKGDRTGLAMTTILSTKQVRRIIKETGLVDNVTDVVHKVVFALAIIPMEGQEIPFYKIRNFVYYLRDKLGYNIQMVTADSFQSVDTIQNFKLHGINSKVLSVDRSRAPYDTLRNAINEERIVSFKHGELEKELLDIEDDKIKNKIDHTSKGSKDISDCIAACIYNASMTNKFEVEAQKKSEILNVMLSGLTGGSDDSEYDINNWK